MPSMAWRTVVINTKVELSYSAGHLFVDDGDGATQSIPLFDVRSIVVHSLQVKTTAYLLNELHKRQISVIFCDERKRPYGEIVGYYDHHATPSRIHDQIRWKKETRREVWKQIIRQKIVMQFAFLDILNLNSDTDKWESYKTGILEGDKTNREGQAARLYFHSLFGKGFHRRWESPTNESLNYGYAILCSAVTRLLTSHGYHPSLGIAHRGATNPLNFSYDLMEPFRPLVDRIVWQSETKTLDRELKNQLIDVTNVMVRYQSKRMTLDTAMDRYILDVTKVLTSMTGMIGEIGFDDA